MNTAEENLAEETSRSLQNEFMNQNLELKLKIKQIENDIICKKIEWENDLRATQKKYENSLNELKEENVRSKLLIEEYKTESEILKEDIINLKLKIENFEQNNSKIKNDIELSSENSKNLNVQLSNWKYKYKCMQQHIDEIKLRETNISKNVKYLIEENVQLKTVSKHHKCVVDFLRLEKLQQIKLLNEDIQSKTSELDSFKEKNSNLVMQIEDLNDKIIKLKEDAQNLTKSLDSENAINKELNKRIIENEKINLENTQTLTECKLTKSNLECQLKRVRENAEQADKQQDTIKKEFYQEKINYELQINDLKTQVNKLRIDLKSTVDEKKEITSKCESLTEKLYLDQLSLKEKINEHNKINLKKVIDNFTQTVQWVDLKIPVNKTVQTDCRNHSQKSMFSQTLPIPIQSTFTQTTPISIDSTNKQSGVIEPREDYSKDDSFLDISNPRDESFPDIFNPRDNLLFYQNDANVDIHTSNSNVMENPVPINSLYEHFQNDKLYDKNSNYLKGSYRNKNLLYEENSAKFEKFFQKGRDSKSDNRYRSKTNLKENRPSGDFDKQKTIKRVKFSETTLEYHEHG